MSKLLLLILIYLPNAFATAPLNATVCARFFSAAAELPLRLVTPADHAMMLDILKRLEASTEFDFVRLAGIRSALSDPSAQVFYYKFNETARADDFFLTLVTQLESENAHDRLRRGRGKVTWRSLYQNFVLRNPLLNFDQAYRAGRHSDPAAVPELRHFYMPSRPEHFERDYTWQEFKRDQAGPLPQPSPRQGRIDTATFFESLRRHLRGKAFPKDILAKVAIDLINEEDLAQPSIFVRIYQAK